MLLQQYISTVTHSGNLTLSAAILPSTNNLHRRWNSNTLALLLSGLQQTSTSMNSSANSATNNRNTSIISQWTLHTLPLNVCNFTLTQRPKFWLPQYTLLSVSRLLPTDDSGLTTSWHIPSIFRVKVPISGNSQDGPIVTFSLSLQVGLSVSGKLDCLSGCIWETNH